jgi:hypothetical protein
MNYQRDREDGALRCPEGLHRSVQLRATNRSSLYDPPGLPDRPDLPGQFDAPGVRDLPELADQPDPRDRRFESWPS